MPGVFQFDNESDWRVIRLFFRLMKLGCFVQHCVILQLTVGIWNKPRDAPQVVAVGLAALSWTVTKGG
jgi:hypothetical protein